VASSVAEVGISAAFALLGCFMTALPWTVVGAIFISALAFGVVADLVKLPLFRRFGLL
jgi:hypothetical protein